MDSVTIAQKYKEHKELVDSYFENDGQKLCMMIDDILFILKFNVEKSDFYSLANEIFLDVLCRYDSSQSFDKFLYSCLVNKFKSEMTRRNRQKRNADRTAISIDAPISDKENITIGDMLADSNTVEDILFQEKAAGYSPKMCQYLNRLSLLQRKVLRLMSIGFKPNEIMEKLHITKEQYEDCYAAIHSYRNIAILM